MGAKSVGNVLENFRSLRVLVWFSVITIFSATLYIISFGTNPNGEACNYNIWSESRIYQWIWNKNNPCVFSLEYYIVFYSQFTLIYLLFDYVRRKVVGFNPSIGWRMAEVSVWFALNWGYLLWLTATDYGVLNWTMGWTSFVGILLFFVPIILLAGGMRLLSNSAVYGYSW